MTAEIADSVTSEDYSLLSLNEMEIRNAERFQALANQGIQVNPGAGYVECLLETLLGDRLLEARVTFQMRVGAQLDNLESQVFRIRLGVK